MRGCSKRSSSVCKSGASSTRFSAWMSKRHVGPSELARRMVTSRNQINRLLDPADTGVSLRTIDKATKALQATFHLVIEEETKKRAAGGRRR